MNSSENIIFCFTEKHGEVRSIDTEHNMSSSAVTSLGCNMLKTAGALGAMRRSFSAAAAVGALLMAITNPLFIQPVIPGGQIPAA